MNENIAAIKRVIQKRKDRGADAESIESYLNGLAETWKNNDTMAQQIEKLKGGE